LLLIAAIIMLAFRVGEETGVAQNKGFIYLLVTYLSMLSVTQDYVASNDRIFNE
jgi:hypothetical protein